MGKVKAVALVAAAALCTDGRIADFTYWREDDRHQYATGSFIWPSGETDTIALVRP